MTREECIKRIKNIKCLFIGTDLDAEALDMAIESLQREDEFLKNLESNEPQFYDEDDYRNGRVPTHGRLIDADALALDAIRWRLCLGLDCSLCPFYRNGVCGVRRMINDAPTVQADRPHGEWIEREDWNGDSYYDCSVCGESFVLCDGTPSMNLYHFCPNCGADMRGGDPE